MTLGSRTANVNDVRTAGIALGANLGEREDTLDAAVEAISNLNGVEVVSRGAWYLTSPVDSSGPDYVNGVVLVKTTLQPEALLEACLGIEKEFGRVRPAGVVNAPRTLDLDLLFYEGVEMETPALTLPHPRMDERLFVLVPLSDVLPDWRTSKGLSIGRRIEELRLKYPKDRVLRL